MHTTPEGELRPPWIDTRRQNLPARPFRKVHLDFHNTPAVGSVGDGFDPAQFVKSLRVGHVNSIVVFAKDMHGYFYYPDGRGPVHPGLHRDLLGEQVAACRDAGITVSAYYCVTWDNHLAEGHPEWLVFDRDRRTHLPRFDETPHWTALCLSAPDFLDHVLADSREILERFPVDGIWYDMPMPIDGECFCHRCLDQIRSVGEDPFDVAVQRRHKQGLLMHYLKATRDLADSIRPGIEVDQNNQTTLGLADRAPYLSNIDIEALPTGGWGYQYFPVDSRYSRTVGTPVCGQTGRFFASWADFGGLKHPRQLEVEVRGIIAQGATCCIGDQPGPSAALDPAVYETIGRAYAEVEQLESWARGAAPVTEAAILVDGPALLDVGSTSGAEHADPHAAAANSVAGTARLLRDARIQFDVVDQVAHLERYRLLVVPDGIAVTADLAAALADYVDRGGAVICAAGSVAERGAVRPWAKALDLTVCGQSPFSVPYLVPAAGLDRAVPAFEYALYGGSQRWEPASGADLRVLATLAEPAFERSAEHFTSHAHSPVAVHTPYVAAVVAGRVGAVSFPIGATYRERGYWVYRELFTAILDAVLPERLVRSSAPSAAEITVTRQDADRARWIVHVVNTSTDVRWGPHLETFDQDMPLHDVELILDLPGDISHAHLAGSGVTLPLTRSERGLRVVVPRVSVGELVVLDIADGVEVDIVNPAGT